MEEDSDPQKPGDTNIGLSASVREKRSRQTVNTFDGVLRRFITNIDSLAETLPLAMTAIQAARKTSVETLNEFVKRYGTTVENSDGNKGFRLSAEHWLRYRKLRLRLERLARAERTVPNSFLVSLISQFDELLGNLIGVIFNTKPDMLNLTEKALTFGELLVFKSLDDARSYIIEKEVEGILRKSHSEQFDWLENKLGIPLRKGLDSWSQFIEIAERRNLLVHTGGSISSQYLTVCKAHSVNLPEGVVVGKSLSVSRKYFSEAYECVFEIGVKLAHVIWRKLSPEQREQADTDLNEISYLLIDDERYELARRLLEFGTCTLKTYSTDKVRRSLIVNCAQTYKWLGNQKKALEIMQGQDWSAASDIFRLADAVIRDDFVEAGRFMQLAGASVDKAAYSDWPLFKEFRKTNIFSEIYEKVFGEPFTNVISSPAELKET